MGQWLTSDEAAVYLGVGATKFYAMAREPGFPRRQIGKKLRFEKSELDAWLKRLSGSAPEEEAVQIDPEREAHAALKEFFDTGGKRAVIELPPRCGREGMLRLLRARAGKKPVLMLAGSVDPPKKTKDD